MKGWVRDIVLCAAVLLSHVALAQQTFTVTRTDDPPPNGCQTGDCSLREAVLAANSANGADTVQLAAATYSVASTIEVAEHLVVAGVDASQTHIVATSALEPILHIDEGAPTYLALRDLSIDALGGNEIEGIGTATLVLEFVDAPNPDGSIYLSYGLGGLVNATGSVVAGFFGCYGCQLGYLEDSEFGDLQLLDIDNQIRMVDVTVDGSGRINSGVRLSSPGGLLMYRVTVQNTRFGVRIESAPAQFSVDGLRYLDNREAFEISHGADFTIARSEFRGNAPTTSGQPAALWIHDGGAHVIVKDSTFANNTGTSDTGGTALVESGAELSVRNSTFVNNGFSVAAAADGARGAAIGYRSDPAGTTLTLQNVTIVAPTVVPAGLEGSALGGRGPGADVLLNIFNSVFAGTCRSDGAVPDFAIGNVQTTNNSCSFGSGNLTGVSRDDLALGPLGDHGGMTATVIPAPGSVVIDAGNNFGCLDTDQRGIGRPSGLRCDAGAIETGDVIFANGFN